MAKKYHPDVRMKDEVKDHTPDADKFRDVAEAYQVLSVHESKVSYDMDRAKNPHLYSPSMRL